VYIIIDSGCSSVSFDNLELSGEYPYGDGMLVIPYVETNPDVNINISGNCKLENTSDYAQAIWSRRPVVLNGQGTDATLSISSVGLGATYVREGLEANNLILNVTAAAGTLAPDESVFAFNGDGGSTAVWRFVDSDVTAQGMGVFNLIGNVSIEGDSQISLVSTDNTKPVLLLYGSESYLQFVNFTGDFSASYQDTEATGPAVLAVSGITFTPDIGDYDVNGAVIGTSTMESTDYYTFLVDSTPQSSVHVTRP